MSAFAIKDPTAPATEAQVKFFVALVTKTTPAIPGFAVEDIAATAALKAQAMTKGEISKAIDGLKAQAATMPKVGGAAKVAAPVAPGYYTFEGKTYVIVVAKTGNHYAKMWTKPEYEGGKSKWEYAPGAAAKIASAAPAPMTLTEVKAWGHEHGHCIKCGAVLSDPFSVENGLGPVCIKSFEV